MTYTEIPMRQSIWSLCTL